MYYVQEKYHLVGCVPKSPAESQAYSSKSRCEWIDNVSPGKLVSAPGFEEYAVKYLRVIASASLLDEVQACLRHYAISRSPTGNETPPSISKIELFFFDSGMMLQRSWFNIASPSCTDGIEDISNAVLSASPHFEASKEIPGLFTRIQEIVSSLLHDKVIRQKGERLFGVVDALRDLHKEMSESQSYLYWSFYLVHPAELDKVWLQQFESSNQLELTTFAETERFYSAWGTVVWVRNWTDEEDFGC
jgi:hypothetical protein